MSAGTERPDQAFLQQALRGSRFADVRWIAETGSTNDDLSDLARQGAGEQVLITDLQTAGRGRRDRIWDAPSGSGVLMSVLLRDIEPQDGFWFVGAIALAASQAIDDRTVSPCRLKWPNDVMLGAGDEQRKVAGVLAQLVDGAAIVGIGINVNWPDSVPAAMAERGTSVNRHRIDRTFVERAPLAADIVRRAIGHLDLDRDQLRRAWKAQCSTLGQQVRLELDRGAIVGIATDIASDGALQIDQDGVLTTHQVGDVVHLRPA
jgi:BirA family biotin operon repressor/biotin-[acetyl-CoA-carboxylase] ligase